MHLDPTLLRAFVAVKEAGGFTRAAERLHLTQSAVSHQIRRLEEQLGRPLLHRTTRRLTLTEDGEDLLRYAQQILQGFDALSRRFTPSPVSGVVRFGVPETFMGERMPSLLCQFARSYPAVRLDVSVTSMLDLRAMIEAGDLDLAIVISEQKHADEALLRRTRLVWVAAEHFHLPGHSLPLAFMPPTCIYRNVAVRALSDTAIDWHIIFSSPGWLGIRAAVLAGLAATVITRDELEPGMKIIDEEYGLPPLPAVGFSLLCGAGGHTPAAREFGRLVLNMAELPPHASTGRRKVG
ncbi:LysR family transcriptional regulator [Dyella sp.]|uniref:LysR family transcriptional regulator n=1 Tax=Dyella sp. TaxID=1869338 RepID=UPI002B45F5AF|nr:LysR family transcriptional regulator [Dyella sp.]HKT30419.1 LysR family transcriptional regulator [Dyella sp.]